MGFYYEKVLRPLLFRQDAEKAHDLGITALDYLGHLGPLCRLMERYNGVRRADPIELFGVRFPNTVGMAAGMDKQGRVWRAAGALGFGFAEIGTITLHKQPGNDKPRVFRYPELGAVINRMGFNNDGAEAVAERLKKSGAHLQRRIPLGLNLGKSRVTPLSEAVADYVGSFQILADFADYFAINVSSPNTPELRRLQGHDFLPNLLEELVKANRSRARKLGTKPKPMLLKIAPDLSYREIDQILETLFAHGLDGIIATNTTIARTGAASRLRETGGLSGPPLHRRSCEVVNYISRSTGGRLPIIGVGGIDTAAAAGRMVDAGAALVQIYTGMIYRGPFLPKELARGLVHHQRKWA
ncbi:MAG: quinone-dependent dihydroorotate dehydrogenase [Opitutales bacterium]